tara:strand:- start:348 stop:1355 length:1008 start_codon:yes stop_codon:yes gene_type:complete
MSLRISLILMIILAYISIGVTCYYTQENQSTYNLEDPPFFYNIDTEKLSKIIVETGEKKQTWYHNKKFDKWFFETPKNTPANIFRWGGITQLLGGPKTQRVIKSEIDDLSKYGLNNPTMIITIELSDTTNIKLLIGSLTPDKTSHYSMVDGYPQLVLVDSSWGNIFERLVNDPPYPDWYYSMDPSTAKEILFYLEGDVILGYSFDKKNNIWNTCNLPITTDPCIGDVIADQENIKDLLQLISNPKINGVEVIGVQNDKEYAKYGAELNAPYIALRIETNLDSGVTEVTRTSITIGSSEPEISENPSKYAVINETSDIVLINEEWGNKLLNYFPNK